MSRSDSRTRRSVRGVLVYLILSLGCTSDPPSAPLVYGELALIVIAGDSQVGVVGAELAFPLVARVTDDRGRPVPDVVVNFRAVSGGGTMWAGSGSSDRLGRVADYWTLGSSTAVPQQVEVRAVTPPGSKEVYGTFTATAMAGAATSIVVYAGDGQVAPVGSTVPVPPMAKVTDAYGNPISGAVVDFTGTAGGGSVTGASQITNAGGIAAVGSWNIGSVACDNTLAATSGTLSGSPLTFAATADGNCWRTLAPMPTPRFAHQVVAFNGILYAIGGVDATGVVLATVEAYDPSTNTWTTRTPIAGGPRSAMALAVAGGRIFSIGGSGGFGEYVSTPEAYDPLSDSWWVTDATMPLSRIGLVAGVGNDGWIYAIGGFNDVDAGGYLSDVHKYLAFINAWQLTDSLTFMPTARQALGLGGISGLLYAAGGENSGGVTGALEVYNANAGSWAPRASMPTARAGLGVGVSGGLLYAVGGRNAAGSLGTLELYTPTTDSWATRTAMPTPRESLGAAMVNGILYAIGGTNGVALGTVEAYKP